MRLIQEGKYIRVDISEYSDPDEMISQIKRHVDGVEWVGKDCDKVSYDVRGDVFHHKAEAILAELMFEEVFPEEAEAIFDDGRCDHVVGCSRIENDISNEPFKTDRTHYANKTAYEVVEILVSQPYIHRLAKYCDKKMDEKLEQAFRKLSEEIIKAKKIDSSKFTAQC